MSECSRLEERIVDFLEGDLSPEDCERFAVHVDRCTTCRDTVRSYRAIREAYRAVPAADVAPEIAARVVDAARPGRTTLRPPSRRRVLTGAFVAAVLVPLVVLWIGERSDPVAALLALGDSERAANELQRAESTYARALALAGDDVRAAEILHRLAGVLVARGDFASALLRLAPLIERYPRYERRSDALLLRGEALVGLGEVGAAIQTYSLAALEFPGEEAQFTRRIRELEERRRKSDALEALQSLGYAGGD